jgi:predicted PurR-regulated permease PerM
MQHHLNLKPIISILLLVASIFVLIILIGRVLTPFIVALILTYILNPIVEKIYIKFKIKRSIISFALSLCMFLLFLIVPFFVIPTLILQLKAIITQIPTVIESLNTNLLPNINNNYGTHLNIDLNTFVTKNIPQLSGHLDMFQPIARNGLVVIEVLVYLILIPFILFFTINGWQKIIAFFDSLIPRSYLKTVHMVIADIDKMLSAYLRGQISVMLIMAFYYAIALYFTGLTSGFMIGFMTGLLVFIPYLGIFTGFLLALLVAFASFTGMNQIFIIFGVFVIGHLLEGGLITPFLVGGRIGLNPVMIILALMIFGKLFGFVGVLLALPLSTIAIVLLKYTKDYYIKSKYYTE